MQTLVISGGSSGIGEACINKFLQNSYFVYNLDVINSSTNEESNNYTWINTDVRDPKAIQNAITQVIKEKQQIDTLIVSAGKHLSATIETTTEEQLNELVDLNLMGAFWLIRHSIKHMKESQKGNIITIGSDQCSVAKYNSTVYGMTKAALLSLTKSIALDYAKFNIRANCIGAGTIDTPLYRNAIKKYSDKSGIALDNIEREEALEQPIGRVGNPNEVAELAYFLSQSSAAFITGALIPIDGGYTTR